MRRSSAEVGGVVGPCRPKRSSTKAIGRERTPYSPGGGGGRRRKVGQDENFWTKLRRRDIRALVKGWGRNAAIGRILSPSPSASTATGIYGSPIASLWRVSAPAEAPLHDGRNPIERQLPIATAPRGVKVTGGKTYLAQTRIGRGTLPGSQKKRGLAHGPKVSGRCHPPEAPGFIPAIYSYINITLTVVQHDPHSTDYLRLIRSVCMW